jgi:uncharacterized SAM-binding protein YcdF (DUF218 family)
MVTSITLSGTSARQASSRYIIQLLLAAGSGIASAWVLGFSWFLYLATQDAPPLRHVDAIVALTGGPDRVETALRLFADGIADRLLVSGAGQRTDLAVLAHLAGIDPGPLEQQITLGHAAHSTRGNALETAAWANDQRIASLLVVTTWFHTPRALVELRRVMPAVTVQPYPIGYLSIADLTRPGTARRVIEEYHKYLAASAGLTAFPFVISIWEAAAAR